MVPQLRNWDTPLTLSHRKTGLDLEQKKRVSICRTLLRMVPQLRNWDTPLTLSHRKTGLNLEKKKRFSYMQDSTKGGSSIKKLGHSIDTIPQKNWSKSRIEKTGFLYAGLY